MSLAMGGNDFCKFFGAKKSKIELVDRKLTPKIDTFGQVDIHVLVIFGDEKVVFWTFPKLFFNCLWSDRVLFLNIYKAYF